MNNKGIPRPVANAAQQGAGIVTNTIMSRAGLLDKLFDPRRDIDNECGYPKDINETQYRVMYDRELGRRVVNVYPEETWKMLPRIFEDPDPDTFTPFEESLDAVEDRHHLLHYLQRIDELSGIGQYGVLLWGLNDGKNLSEPVEGWEGWEDVTGVPATAQRPERRLIFIRALDASLVRISQYEGDPTNPRYGQPTMYTLTLRDPRNMEASATTTPAGEATNQTSVHWTRITHVADNRKTSEVLGTPRMEAVWNRLYDLRKVLGGSGEMYWRGGFPGISLETQPGMENAELDEEATREMMFDYMNGLQRYLALTGMTAKSLAPQIADPKASFEVQVKAMCIILGVPYRVFVGIEEGVVSGDQATRAWDSRLASRQARYVTPMLIDPVLQRLVDYGVLRAPVKPQGWSVEWPDLTSPSEVERADVLVKKTEAFAKYVGGGVDTLIPPLEYLTKICGMEQDTAHSILEAAIEHIEETEAHDEEKQAAAAQAVAGVPALGTPKAKGGVKE